MLKIEPRLVLCCISKSPVSKYFPRKGPGRDILYIFKVLCGEIMSWSLSGFETSHLGSRMQSQVRIEKRVYQCGLA